MKGKQKNSSLAAMQSLAGLMMDKIDPALISSGAEKVKRSLERVGTSNSEEQNPEARHRWQDRVIEQEIPVGSSVLDLGCGSGELLARLTDMKRVHGQGVEIDSEQVMDCVERGVSVFQTDIRSGLKGFPDGCFDYVVLEETLQTLTSPLEVLTEMLRVGRRSIVSFPNFGYWRVRLDLGVRGRMPVTEWLPYRWYNTPNIHLLTIQDFLDWMEESAIRLVEAYCFAEGKVRTLGPEDNVYAEEALFVIENS